MFRFVYSHPDIEQLVRDLAQSLGTKPVNGIITLPPTVADGIYSGVRLPNDLQLNIINCTLNQDWLIRRAKREEGEEIYTLRVNELVIPGSLQVTIGDEQVMEANTARSVVYLTSSRFEWSYHGTKGTKFRGVNVMFSREWAAKNLGITDHEESPLMFFSMQSGRFTQEPLDNDYRRLMQEIEIADSRHPLYLNMLQNRCSLIIERFFTHAFEKHSDPAALRKISRKDIDRMMQVEKIITTDPFLPAPSITELAKRMSVSESKLKKDFKLVYGSPVHEYYRKFRMNAARDKLLTGNFSVKEVALDLGYSNLSNFTDAFKKEFGILPSQLF